MGFVKERLDNRGEDFYEVTGSIGQRIRHRDSHETNQWLGTSFESLKKFVKASNALVQNNIRLSIQNPLSLIYVQNDNDTNEAFYKTFDSSVGGYSFYIM